MSINSAWSSIEQSSRFLDADLRTHVERGLKQHISHLDTLSAQADNLAEAAAYNQRFMSSCMQLEATVKTAQREAAKQYNLGSLSMVTGSEKKIALALRGQDYKR